MRFPGNRVLRPYTYLWVLVLSLSGLSCLRDGYAALFMVTLPHFWVPARSWRESARFSALGTLAGNHRRDRRPRGGPRPDRAGSARGGEADRQAGPPRRR
ncbi:hypothetical protein [Nonomuraea fuscirosea]|uniref:hypothetical protein n=1 Tax=Nonomuraea fuscirosea TaxID=1291556 RepID=UPI003402895C